MSSPNAKLGSVSRGNRKLPLVVPIFLVTELAGVLFGSETGPLLIGAEVLDAPAVRISPPISKFPKEIRIGSPGWALMKSSTVLMNASASAMAFTALTTGAYLVLPITRLPSPSRFCSSGAAPSAAKSGIGVVKTLTIGSSGLVTSRTLSTIGLRKLLMNSPKSNWTFSKEMTGASPNVALLSPVVLMTTSAKSWL